jgi:hypothetical protein
MLRKKRTQGFCAIVATLLLVLGMSTASFSLPAPMPAVTDYTLPQSGPSVKIIGSSGDVSAACTADSTTTARILREGFPMGSVHVPNGSSITTITFWGTNVEAVAGVAGYDQDHVAITLTVAADQIVELPASIACFKYVLPVTNASGALYFHFER